MQRLAPNKNRKRRKDDETEKGRGTPTPATTAGNAPRMRGAFWQTKHIAQRATSTGDTTALLSDTLDQFWFTHWHGEHSADAGSGPAGDCTGSNHLSPHP
jgi:hypothetical protein